MRRYEENRSSLLIIPSLIAELGAFWTAGSNQKTVWRYCGEGLPLSITKLGHSTQFHRNKSTESTVDQLPAWQIREKEKGMEPVLTFRFLTSKKFTCLAKYLKDALRFFAIDDKFYSPYIRKAWDNQFVKSIFLEGRGAMFYQLKTGHSEHRRWKYYLKPRTDAEIACFLDIQLETLEYYGHCQVADSEPPTTPPRGTTVVNRVRKQYLVWVSLEESILHNLTFPISQNASLLALFFAHKHI